MGRRHVCVATRNAEAQGQGCHEVVASFGEIAAEVIMVRQEEDEEAAAEPEDEDDEDDGGVGLAVTPFRVPSCTIN